LSGTKVWRQSTVSYRCQHNARLVSERFRARKVRQLDRLGCAAINRQRPFKQCARGGHVAGKCGGLQLRDDLFRVDHFAQPRRSIDASRLAAFGIT